MPRPVTSFASRARLPAWGRRLLAGGILLAGLGLGGGGPDLPSAEADELRTLDTFFHGRVELDRREVVITYDFHDKEQLKDFRDSVPWPIEKRGGQKIGWFDERLEVVGNAGARHVARFKGTVFVTLKVRLDNDKDIGGWIEPSAGGVDFATYTLHEHFFHTWNNKTGGQHSIIKFGNQWREPGASEDFIGFRYIDRRPGQETLRAGDEVEMTFGVKRGKLHMTTPEFDLKGNDRGKKLKTVHVGLYAIKGRALFDNVVIRGTLDAKWLKEEGLELAVAERPAGEGLDPETQALADDHAKGVSKATRKLVRIVQDTGRDPALRSAVIEVLATGPRGAVRSLQGLLYHDDVVVRTDGIGIIKRLLGKDWGYKPKGSDGARSKAIQAMNKELEENPGLLEDQ